VDTQFDNSNCGMCGNTCASGATCTNGTCQCPSGQNNCSGTCSDNLSDPMNCGGCGLRCESGDTCSSGFCQLGYYYFWQIASGWGACDQPCGPGNQTRTVYCRRSSDFAIAQEVACNAAARPPSVQGCFTSCPFPDASVPPPFDAGSD
jgi:hypothetical protein